MFFCGLEIPSMGVKEFGEATIENALPPQFRASSLCVCARCHVCMYLTHVEMHVCMYVHARMCMHMPAYVCIYACTHVCRCNRVCMLHLYMYITVYLYLYLYINMFMSIICTYVLCLFSLLAIRQY